MSKGFKDHFSTQSTTYTQFRPTYPRELFTWLAGLVDSRHTAWDCATGNGQAAIGLSEFFHRVIATDASANQIAQTTPHEKISYRVAPAEQSGLADNSVDLITVAQAAHWFDHAAFNQEAKRVLKANGVIVLWCYELQKVDDDIDRIVDYLYENILGDYWPAERRHIENRYSDIPLPFNPVEPPALSLRVEWSVEQQLGYFRSWSSSARYLESTGTDAVSLVENDLRKQWGKRARTVQWPLYIKAGRN